MKTFEANKDKSIILYGAAAIGKIMYDKFRAHGFTVIGFIDKRAQEIKRFCDLPVWMLSDVPEDLKADSEVFVYVSVKNVFEHETIAKELVAANFDKIIYKPYGALMDSLNSAHKQMDAAYENFASDIWQKLEAVPTTDMIKTDYTKDYALISADGSYATAFIPIDYVYTNNYENSPMEKWGNVNVLALFTHINFFKYLNGDTAANYEDYLEAYCLFTAGLQGAITPTDAWKDNVLRNRTQIYEQMCLSLQIDHEFFIRNAPTAIWNKKGYFNLTSGKHRSAFLAARGNNHIPLRVPKEDYDLFLNEQRVKKFISFSRDEYLDIEQQALPHPYFYRATGINKSFYYGFLRVVINKLARRLYDRFKQVDFSKLSILDCSGDLALFGIYFARMGSRVYYGGEKNKWLSQIRDFADVDIKNYDPSLCRLNIIFLDLNYAGTEKAINNTFDTVFVICSSSRKFDDFCRGQKVVNGERIFNTIHECGIKEVYECTLGVS